MARPLWAQWSTAFTAEGAEARRGSQRNCNSFRRDLIERYREDPRPRVQAYARDRARELGQYMAWEQRKAARDVAQRRRDWNEE